MAQIPGSKLQQGTTMGPGDYILSSPNGVYQLTMQAGGDLTLGLATQASQPPAWAWDSKTTGTHPSCTMLQGDLQISDSGVLISHSQTNARKGYLQVLDSGQVEILNQNGSQLTPPWVNGSMHAP